MLHEEAGEGPLQRSFLGEEWDTGYDANGPRRFGPGTKIRRLAKPNETSKRAAEAVDHSVGEGRGSGGGNELQGFA